MQKKRSKRKSASSKKAAELDIKKDNSQRNYELLGLFFVCAGVVSLCGIVGLNVGFVGLKVAKFLQYFFGIGSFVAAGAMVAAGGYFIMRHQRPPFVARLWGGVGFFAFFLAMYHHFLVKVGAEILPESLVHGGGLLGGAICLVLHKVVGDAGTPVVLGIGMVGTFLVMTTWSLAQGIINTKETAEKGADVAVKATAVVYDKTVEIGGKTKEHIQEYVQEHIGDVGETLNNLRGKRFLRQYEEDSAFLLEADGAGVPREKVGVAARGAENTAPKPNVTREMRGGGSISKRTDARVVRETVQMRTQGNAQGQVRENTPPPTNAAELAELTPAAAGFFGEKFSTNVAAEGLPSLASQLGVEEVPTRRPINNDTKSSAVEFRLGGESASVVDELSQEQESGWLEEHEDAEPALEIEWEGLSFAGVAGTDEENVAEDEVPVADAVADVDDVAELDIADAWDSVVPAGEADLSQEAVDVASESDLPQEVSQSDLDYEDDEYDYGLGSMEITYGKADNVLDDAVACVLGGEDEPELDDFSDGLVMDEPVDEVTDEFADDAVEYDVEEIWEDAKELPSQAEVVELSDEEVSEEAAEAEELEEVEETEEVEAPPYILPPLHLLSKDAKVMSENLSQEIANNAQILGETLANFKVKASILNACHGPAVTRYEVKPAPGVKVSKITGLADDIALNMAATAVRIEQIPGKAAIGIEVPNKELESVQLREVLENPAFEAAKSRLTVGLGKDISGQAIFADLAKMPHLLVAGATGSGKSVCINTLITSILFKAKPTEVKFILIDPKMVELSVYNDIPHLMVPVVTDSRKAASVLNWAVQEMEKRYGLIAQVGVRNMEGYNRLFEDVPEKQLPSIVIIIDELADLMMVAPHDVEDAICRIAQKARAAGIYLVLATQRPSVNVITGVIKANIPSRISFAVTSQIDSRTILDAAGAEKLLGKGDMLFKPQEANKAVRIQGVFVSDKEVEMLVEYIRGQGHKPEVNQEIIDFTNKEAEDEAEAETADKAKAAKPKIDSLLRDAVELTMSTNNASASSFQRRYHIGYSRAGRLLDTMEQLGIVGPPQGSKPREILVTEAQAFEIMDNYEAK